MYTSSQYYILLTRYVMDNRFDFINVFVILTLIYYLLITIKKFTEKNENGNEYFDAITY